MIEVTITNDTEFQDPAEKIEQVVRSILTDHQVAQGSVNIAIVDDPTIHQLNRDHLQHDYPTDVLSFLLEREGDYLEGEIIISSDTATANAAEYGCSDTAECLLYAIHGSLHLVGYDDQNATDRAAIRQAEQTYLAQVGELQPDRNGVPSSTKTEEPER